MRWNIYRKMFLFATMMIVSTVSLLGYLTYRESEAMLVNRMKQSSLLTMENAANHLIKYYIHDIETTLHILTGDPLLTDLPSAQTTSLLLDKWEQHRRYSENIWSIRYTPIHGPVIMIPKSTLPDGSDESKNFGNQGSTDANIEWSKPHWN